MKKNLVILCGVVVVTFSVCVSAAKTIYVNGTCGDDAWTGLEASCASVGTGPKASINGAVQAAAIGDTVIVADGIYTGLLNREIGINKDITLKSQNGPAGCIIDCQDSSRAFLFTGVITNNCVIEGFTMLNAKSADNGGALACVNNISPTIKNCVFNSCQAAGNGGVMYCFNSKPRIIQSTFMNCQAVQGGAIYLADGAFPMIDWCMFQSNSAETGGAIGMKNAAATILDSNFISNSIRSNASSGGGGAIFCDLSSPYIAYCAFTSNRCDICPGGAMALFNRSCPLILNSDFAANISWAGGAFSCFDNSIASFTDCSFGNHLSVGVIESQSSMSLNNCIATGNQGVLFDAKYQSSITIKSCQIKFNTEHQNTPNGIVIALNQSSATITDTDISGNRAVVGSMQEQSRMSFDQCLITGNMGMPGGIYADQGSDLTILNTTIADNRFFGLPLSAIKNSILCDDGEFPINLPVNISYSAISPVNPVAIQGPGNLFVAPLFGQPGHFNDMGTPDNLLDDVWVCGQYYLKSRAGRWDSAAKKWVYDAVDSPCIDAADPADAVDDEPFPNGGRRNMGFEGGSEYASKVPVCATPIEGDTNSDCKIDMADLSVIAAHWLECNLVPNSLCL